MSSLFLRIYLSALAFLLIAFFIILYFANNIIFNELLIDNSTHLSQVISQSLKTKDKSTWQAEINTYNALATDYTLSLLTSDDLNESEQQALLSMKDKNSITISDNILGRTDLYALYALPNTKWILKIDEDNDSGNELNNLADTIIFFLLLMLPLAFALFLLVRKLTKPIQHLALVAKKLGNGDLNARADNNLLPPMNTLADGFNRMAEQLNETIQEQQILVGAIPHELRSPLGRIRFSLDMTRKNITAEDYRKDIEIIDYYVDQMQTTVDEILELNRLQNQPLTNPKTFSLQPIIEDLTKQLRDESPELKLVVDCNKSQTISGNASLAKHAISNLISNAQRHAKATIRIKVYKKDHHTIVQVDNDGTSIDDDKIQNIFFPFATASDSRNRKTSGIGLGLAIVQLIMKKHQGTVSVSHSDLGGARFELHWNKSTQEEPSHAYIL